MNVVGPAKHQINDKRNIWTNVPKPDLGTSIALDLLLALLVTAAAALPLLCCFRERTSLFEMLRSASLLKSVSELTRRADLRDSSSRTSSILARMVSSL